MAVSVPVAKGRRKKPKPQFSGPMCRLTDDWRRWLRNFAIGFVVGVPILIILGHAGSGGYDGIFQVHYWIPFVPTHDHIVSLKEPWDNWSLMPDERRHLVRNASIAAMAALGYRLATYHPEKFLYAKINPLDWFAMAMPGVPSIKKRLGTEMRRDLIEAGKLEPDDTTWRTPINPETTFEKVMTLPVTIVVCSVLGVGVFAGYSRLQARFTFLPKPGIASVSHTVVPLFEKLQGTVLTDFVVKVMVFVPVFIGTLFLLCMYDAAQRFLIGDRMARRVAALGRKKLATEEYNEALLKPPAYYLLAWRSAWEYYAKIVIAGQNEVFSPHRMSAGQKGRVRMIVLFVLGLAVLGGFWLYKFA